MVEWGRVLKPSGSVWINLGDKYVSDNRGSGTDEKRGEAKHAPRGPAGYPTGGWQHKSLLGLPWRFAIRQIDAGWILRAEVVWDKPNGLPESVTDRVRRSHETWFHFTREPRYFSGVDEIREVYAPASLEAYARGGLRASHGNAEHPSRSRSNRQRLDGDNLDDWQGNPLGRLPGSVWSIPSEPLLIPDDTRKLLDLPDHFAAFPQEWPRRIITGWSPTGICTVCGALLLPYGYGTSTTAATGAETLRGVSNADALRPHQELGHATPSAEDQSVLREGLRGQTQREDAPFDERLDASDQGVHPSPASGASDGRSVGLRVGTSESDSGPFGASTHDQRDRSSQKWDQGRQPTGESGIDGEGRSRSTTEAAGRASPVSTLWGDDPDLPECQACGSREFRASVILDPFGGTGTTSGVARTLGRYGISNDLSESYNRLAIWRITQSGHFTKTEQRSWADRQGQLL